MEEPITHQHFLVHKPFGYLSQFRSQASKEQKKNFLGSLHDFPEGTMPIGRLDEEVVPAHRLAWDYLFGRLTGPASGTCT